MLFCNIVSNMLIDGGVCDKAENTSLLALTSMPHCSDPTIHHIHHILSSHCCLTFQSINMCIFRHLLYRVFVICQERHPLMYFSDTWM